MIGTPSVVVSVPRPFNLPLRNADFAHGLDGWQGLMTTGPWTVDGDGKVHPGEASTASGQIALVTTPDNMMPTERRSTRNGLLTISGYTPVPGRLTARFSVQDSSTVPLGIVTLGGGGGTNNYADIPAGEFTLTLTDNISGAQTLTMGPAFTFKPTALDPVPDLSTFTVHQLSLRAEYATTDVTCLCDDVAIKHGRDDGSGQPDASSATINLSYDTTDTTVQGNDLVAALFIGAPVTVSVTFNGTTYTRFVGSLTDIAIGWDDAGDESPHMVNMQLVAVSPLATLGRTIIGDVPWPTELDGARAVHIFDRAQWRGSRVTYLADAGTVQILARDVDSQPALGLLQSVAESAEGTLWQRLDGTVIYSDALKRTTATPVLTLDACDLLVSPTWKEDLAGLVNSVSIGYGDAGEGEQPRYLGSDLASIALYGLYDYSVATELATRDDAFNVAQDVLAKQSEPGWNLSALPVDVTGLSAALTSALLGIDMHALIELANMPDTGGPPTEAWLWVEGWSESFSAGVHDMTLAVTDYARSAGAATWDTWGMSTWDSTPATVTWDSARRQPVVGGPQWDSLTGTWDALTATWNALK